MTTIKANGVANDNFEDLYFVFDVMRIDRSFIFAVIIACLSFLVALGVYCFARINPPDILATFNRVPNSLASYGDLFGNAPSFFYTLAVGITIGLCASGHAKAIRHCVCWTGIAMVLELFQTAVISELVLIHFLPMLPDSVSSLIGPYWIRGTYDSLDLFATLTGGLVALLLLSYLKVGIGDEVAA